MIYKVFVVSCVLAACQAGLVPTQYVQGHGISSQSIVRHDSPAHYAAAPVAHYAPSPVIAKVIAPIAHIDEYAHPKYDFSYSVSDGHTGDNKNQRESRDGDVVKGEYSFLEADGSVRTVHYSADDHNGFNAVVSNSAPGHHASPVIHAAPAYYH